MVLTDNERKDLHSALVEYLRVHGMESAAAAVTTSLEAHGPFLDKPTALESKWNTLVRLNRQVALLEQKCKRLENEVDELQDPTKRAASAKDMLPREPARATFEGHRDTITSVAFSPFDPVVFSASEDGTVRAWDLQTKTCSATYRHSEGVACVAVEPTKGRTLAVGCGDQAVRLYEDGDCTMTLHGHDFAITSVAWIKSAARTLMSTSRDGEVRAWDATRGAVVASKHLDGFSRIVATCATQLIAVGCEEMVHLMTVGARELTPVRRLGPLPNIIQTIAFTNAAADAVLVEHYGTAEQKATLKARAKRAVTTNGDAGSASVSSEALSAPPLVDPMFVAVGGRDRNVTIFEVQSGSAVMTLTVHENWVREVAFAANGKHLLSVSDDSKLVATDLVTRKPVKIITAHDHFVTCLALHPTAPLLATGSADNTVKVWGCGL
jgi:platelet-activating factor acetylhydrolase IB subunit alpha